MAPPGRSHPVANVIDQFFNVIDHSPASASARATPEGAACDVNRGISYGAVGISKYRLITLGREDSAACSTCSASSTVLTSGVVACDVNWGISYGT